MKIVNVKKSKEPVPKKLLCPDGHKVDVNISEDSRYESIIVYCDKCKKHVEFTKEEVDLAG